VSLLLPYTTTPPATSLPWAYWQYVLSRARMPRFVLANQATASKRRCYFQVVSSTDGMTAVTTEAGSQPQISTDGGAWTNTGIGVLTHIGSGRYYADVTQAAIATTGLIIETRYKGASTAECPGDTLHIVAFDPDLATNLGLSYLTNIGAPVGASISVDIAAIQAKTVNLPASPAAVGSNMGTVTSVTGSVGSVTGAVGSVTGAVGSVTGAVGSVTGNVGGNVVGSTASVTGAVGSVTGAVGSVTGNVGGNVVGTVASVVGNVGGNVTGTVASVVGDVGGKVLGGGAGVMTAAGVWALTNTGAAAYAGGAVASVTGNVGGNVTGTVGSVVGAVGSVTGNVGGNVVGTVGAAASVTGNVGGNVVGSVGSVTGAVGSVTGAVGSVTGNVGGNVVGTVGAAASVTGNVGGKVLGGGATAITGAGVWAFNDAGAALSTYAGGAVASVTGNVGGNVVGSVGSVTGAVGSVTGAVGSVTGNVGGNVVGTTGAAASVTGNVGGNVTGSVGSVLGAVGSVTGAVGSVTGAVGSVTGNVGGNVTGTVASVVGDVGGKILGGGAGTITAGGVWAFTNTGAAAYAGGAVASVTGNVGGNVTGTVASVVGNVGGNVTGTVGSVVGAVGSVTGNLGGNVVGNVNGKVIGGGVTAITGPGAWVYNDAGAAVSTYAGGAVASVTGNVGGNVTGTVGSVVGAVGSVTGNVGGNVVGTTGAAASVTGNVGGNVTGTVGSVVGAVGSVTGNVGGNVTGTVASVVGDVGGKVLGGGAGTITGAGVWAFTNTGAAISTYAGGAVASVTGNVGGNVVGTVASVVGNVGGNVTGTVGSVVGAVGSVTGNVGGNVVGTTGAAASVTGNVGGNVVGTVGSVVGAVGSVTGNVGGNVTGSVGSVLGAVASVTGAVGSVTNDIGGKVLGGGAGVITGTGVRAIDGSGNAIAPASTAVSNADYTAGRALKLDNLDATISSRSVYAGGAVASVTGDVGGKVLGGGAGVMTAAGVRAVDSSGNAIAPASTAVSNVDYTGARAIKIDNLDTTISSRSTLTATNVWNETVPGAYGAGTAGGKVGTDLDATISSRSTYSGGAVASVSGAVGSVTGDVGGKVLGGGAGVITGTGVYAVDSSGNAIAPASTAVSNADYTGARALKIDNLDATISSRSTLTQAQILSDTTPFQGARIDAAISSRSTLTAANVWNEALPGAYGAGTAGGKVGTDLDATISSRSTYSGGAVASVSGAVGSVTGDVGGKVIGGGVGTITGTGVRAVDASGNAIAPASTAVSNVDYTAGRATKIDYLDVSVLSRSTLTAANVWDEALAGHLGVGSTGAALNAAGGAGDPWSTLIPGAYGAGTAGKILGDNINATISSRSTFAGGAVASVTGDVGGKVLGGGAGVIVGTGAQSDIYSVATSATAATNLKLQFDGSGLSGDAYPARQDQLTNIVSTGAAINQSAGAFTLTTGSVISGTYLSTAARDGVYHQLADTAGTLDCYYQFDIGADGVPTGSTFYGYVNGDNDLCNIWGWDFTAGAWVQIGTVPGIAGSVEAASSFAMFTSMAGTGALLNPAGVPAIGKAYIRLQATGLTSANIYVDQIYISYAVVRRSVGYANGMVWLDTTAGYSGTTPFIHGMADYPANTLANALSICNSLGIRYIHIANGDAIVLTTPLTNFMLVGEFWRLDLNGQVLTDCVFTGADVDGACTGYVEFNNCDIGIATLPLCEMHTTGLEDTITLNTVGDYFFESCYAEVSGIPPTIDFNIAVGPCSVVMRRYSGAINVINLLAGDNLSIDGNGAITIDASCTGGTVRIQGAFTLTDNSGGAVTILDTARFAEDQNMTSLTGNVAGKILGGGAGTITGTGAWVKDFAGANVAPAATAVSNVDYTGARALKLDNLDATISSRSTYSGGAVASVTGDVGGKVLGGGAGVMTAAGVRAVDASGNAIAPASTAVSNADYTAGRAVKIDNLDATISSRSTLTQAQILSDTTPFQGARIDAAISSRSTFAGGAVASVTGDIGGKVLGGGAGVMSGNGVRAVDSSGNAIAPASTALSTVTWTGGRAANLDNLNATISSRSTLTAANVWDELLAGHLGAGSTGAALNGAGAAGDPWTTLIPGAYGAGTAGKILGDNINATISSRSTLTQNQILSDATPFAGADIDATISSRSTYSGGPVASVTGDVGGKLLGGGAGVITGTGTRAVDASGNNIAPASTAVSNVDYSIARAGKLDNLDATITSRLAAASYTAPDNADIALIKAKTDNLPVDPASNTVVNTRAASATALSTATWTNGRAAKIDNLDATVSSRSTITPFDVWSEGVPGAYGVATAGKVLGTNLDATITSRPSGTDYTALRAAKLDNIDVVVSTRAPASTALTTATWTNARAAKIDNLDTNVGSRATNGAIWNEAIAGHLIPGSVGEALNNAAGSADPWATVVPGAYGAGTAGKILGDNLNATVSSRSTLTQLQILSDATPFAGARIDDAITSRAAAASYTPARAIKLDNLDAAVSSRSTLTQASIISDATPFQGAFINDYVTSRAPAATAIDNTTWTNARAAKLDDLDATISSRAPAATAVSNATWTNPRAARLDNIDATVSSRMAQASYTAPDNATIAAIDAKTTNLPVDPASTTDVNTRAPASTALSNVTWTNPRAATLDNLDATISSRAPASTALSNATWTGARALKIDYLDTNISSRSTLTQNQILSDAHPFAGANIDTTISSRADSADYTALRAAKLDNIDATVSSRATQVTANAIKLNTDNIPASPALEATSQDIKTAVTAISVSGADLEAMMGRNSVMRAISYNADGNMTEAELRSYDTANNAATDDGVTGLRKKWRIVQTYNDWSRPEKLIGTDKP
jgi:hypothetical protein